MRQEYLMQSLSFLTYDGLTLHRDEHN